MKKNVLIIGAGGVGQVVAHKCAQHNLQLGDIHIASRTIRKCLALIDGIHEKGVLQNPKGVLKAHTLDAMDTAATRKLIEQTGAQIVVSECPACLTQMNKAAERSGGKFKVMHISQVL